MEQSEQSEQSEYLEKLAAMKSKYKVEMQKLQREYALAQSPYRVGDVVTDHIGTIKIDRIEYETSDLGRNVLCVYVGPCLTTKGIPYKSGERRAVYQRNVKHNPR